MDNIDVRVALGKIAKQERVKAGLSYSDVYPYSKFTTKKMARLEEGRYFAEFESLLSEYLGNIDFAKKRSTGEG